MLMLLIELSLARFFYLVSKHSTKMLRKFRIFHSTIPAALFAQETHTFGRPGARA
jgi:hypothetical protein